MCIIQGVYMFYLEEVEIRCPKFSVKVKITAPESSCEPKQNQFTGGI